MHTSLTTQVVCLFLALICFRPIEGVLADGDKTEPEKRLQMAQQLTDIRENSSQPFRLSGIVQLFDERGHAQKGTYELDWEKPTQWKDELKLPDFSQSRLVNGEQLFLSRNPKPLLSKELLELLRFLEFPTLVRPFPGETVSEQRKNVGREIGIEFRFQNRVLKTLYLDPDSSVPTRIDTANNNVVYLFQNYSVFGGHQFPHVLTVQRLGKLLLEVQVQELVTASFSQGSFAPPDGPSFRWCPNPTPAKPTPDQRYFPIPWPLRGEPMKRHVVIYGIMGPDGQWHNVTVVKSGGKEVDSYWTNVMISQGFTPAMCGTEPVMQEVVEEFGGL
jgi:hypothetical protein